MIKYINLFVFFVFCLFGSDANPSNPEYLKYVKEVTDNFIKEMEEELGLRCCGTGGSMPHNIEKIKVLFTARCPIKLEDARKLEVTAAERLLKRINQHEKIKPFLKKYPFDSECIGISISFQNEEGWPLDGSVALMYLAKNKIIYRAAEMQKKKGIPFYDLRDPDNIIYEPPKEHIEEELVPLHEESYEEALKIVTGGTVKKKE